MLTRRCSAVPLPPHRLFVAEEVVVEDVWDPFLFTSRRMYPVLLPHHLLERHLREQHLLGDSLLRRTFHHRPHS